MKVAWRVVLLCVVTGGWSMAACAPPTPKVEPRSMPRGMDRDPLAPANIQDRSMHRIA